MIPPPIPMPRRRPPSPSRFADDVLNGVERAALYDQIARNQYPRTREDYRRHEDELTRLNRHWHNLKFPTPAPKPKKAEDSMTMATQSLTMTGTSTRMRGKYMSSYRLQKERQKQQHVTLSQKILEGAVNAQFADPVAVVAAVTRALQQAGCDMGTIQLALQNATVYFAVNEQNGELVINVQLESV
jgi:hypothetical protein